MSSALSMAPSTTVATWRLELALDPDLPAETVLAVGYRRWGVALAARLRGEFALLIWDREHERGLLVADQIGIRRVFVRSEGRRLWFGSEVRNLLALIPSRPAPDPVAVSHWLAQSAPPEGATLYEGITGLEWGHLVELDSNGWAPQRYWQPAYQESLDLPHRELIEEIGGALRRAVARRVTPEAPTGVLMSGGLDSTSVAALAHSLSENGALAFSTTFPNYPRIDESAWIDELEAHVGLPVVRYAASGPGLIASALAYLREWELPLHAWSEAWIQPLLRGAGERGVTAILSGEGGDELFGSRYYLIADLMRGGHFVAAARFAREVPEAGGRTPRNVFFRLLWEFGVLGLAPAAAEAAWNRMAPRSNSTPWWASERCARLLRTGGLSSWRNGDGPRWWSAQTHTLTAKAHAFGMFDHERRRCEQVGLEARHPLFDLELFELMFRVPPALCSEGNLSRPHLRETMNGLSPDFVRLRPSKSVFDQVVIDALTGPEFVGLRVILDNATEVGAYARPQAIRDLLNTAPPRQRGHPFAWTQDVLRLAALEVWLRYQGDSSLPEKLLEDPRIPPVDDGSADLRSAAHS